MKNYDLDAQGFDLALVVGGRQSHRGKPQNKKNASFIHNIKVLNNIILIGLEVLNVTIVEN